MCDLVGEAPMRSICAVAILVLTAQAAMACGCDEICKPGEVYSDDAEMCVPDAQPVS